MMEGFRGIMDGELREFISASARFGVEIFETLADLVRRVFEAESEFIDAGLRRPAPDNDAELRRLATPVLDMIQEIQNVRELNRNPDYNNHFATIGESIWALSWITVKNTPLQFMQDMKDAGVYYGNRVLIAYRGPGNEHHATWINKWNSVLTALEGYVRQYHRTGFSWQVARRDGGGDGPFNPFVPPPPPPPILGMGDAPAPPVGGANIDPEVSADRQQLMIQISQGLKITKMLRPVNRDGDQQAAPGAQQAAPGAQRPAPSARRAGAPIAQRAPVNPPLFGLEGRKWRVEYHFTADLHLNPNDMSESLSMFKCERTTLTTDAKMNAVTINNCKRCVVVLSHIISSVELIRCANVEVRCLGSCPNVTIDNCDCVQVFLSNDSANCEVITSKSTSTNICLIGQDDYVEYPVPEQIKTVILNGILRSSVVEHNM